MEQLLENELTRKKGEEAQLLEKLVGKAKKEQKEGRQLMLKQMFKTMEQEFRQNQQHASGGETYPILPFPGEISYRCYTGTPFEIPLRNFSCKSIFCLFFAF